MDPGATPMQLSPDAVTSSADFLVFLVVGMFAGAHCLGMCGPLVSIYTNRVAEHTESRREDTLTLFAVRQHLLFNLGRTAGYAVVGALFWFLGGAVFTSIDGIVPVSNAVRGATDILVGLFILTAGLSYVFRRTHTSIPDPVARFSGLFSWVSGHLTSRIDRLAGSPRIVGLGTVHAPCRAPSSIRRTSLPLPSMTPSRVVSHSVYLDSAPYRRSSHTERCWGQSPPSDGLRFIAVWVQRSSCWATFPSPTSLYSSGSTYPTSTSRSISHSHD